MTIIGEIKIAIVRLIVMARNFKMTDQRRLERFLSERINKFKKHDDTLLFMHYYMRHAQNASILGTQLQIRT